MASFNKVLLMGNVTRDPEVRFTTGGMAVCVVGMAMNRRFTTAQGQDREEVCFVDVEVFGKQAESCGQYLRKGAPVFVEGSLRFDQWDDKATGKKRSKLVVRAERVQFLGAPRSFGEDGGAPAEAEAGGAPRPARPAAPERSAAPSAPRASSDQHPPEMPAAGNDGPTEPLDDIPF